MQGKKKKVSCLCCKNGRLLDVVIEDQTGNEKIDIKCPVCKNVIRITFHNRKANLMLTDPPYGVSFKSSSSLTIKNDSIKGNEFYQFLLASFTNMKNHMEKGAGAYCFHADTEGLCGQCMADHADSLSCIGEGSCFMSPNEIVRSTVHPYKNSRV